MENVINIVFIILFNYYILIKYKRGMCVRG